MSIFLIRLSVAVIPLIILIGGIILLTSLRRPHSRCQLRALSALRRTLAYGIYLK